MHYKPSDLWGMTFKECLIAIEGYNRKQTELALMFRRAAYITHISMVEKAAKPEQLWPIDVWWVEEEKPQSRLLERLEEQRMIDKALKEKNGS